MKKSIILVFAAGAALLACNKNEAISTSGVSDQDRVVKFEMTKLYSFDTKAAIGVNSAVAIYADNLANASNVSYTVSEMPTAEPSAVGILSGEAIKWGIEQMGTNTSTKFFAMYPYADGDQRNAFSTSTALAYNIDSDEYARDFMVDVVDQYPGSDVEHPNPVTFNLEHPFAMLRYVITNSSDDAIRFVKIHGVHKTGNLAYGTAAVTATGDALNAGTAAELSSESVAGNVYTYYSVIVPESSINPVITITTWTGATSTYALSAAQDFVAGKKYTASITYNHTHGVTTSNRTVEAGFNITDWDAEDVTAGTESGYTDDTSNWPILKGTGFGSSWESGLRMSCVGENSFRKVITKSGDVQFKVYKENGTWYGFDSTETVDGWTKITTSTDGSAGNISLTGENGYYTIYYYAKSNSDPHEVWIKSGDVTR